jgi:DNA-binding MarR family transcriptional regulator
MSATMNLREWRTKRARALSRTTEHKDCSSTARRVALHMVRSRDAIDGAGMFRSPRKLAKELGLSESTIRRALKELETKGVFVKERRKDSRGTGRRDTTSAYHLRDELLPERLRSVTVTHLRAASASDTPADRPVDTPRSTALSSAVRRLSQESQEEALFQSAVSTKGEGQGISREGSIPDQTYVHDSPRHEVPPLQEPVRRDVHKLPWVGEPDDLARVQAALGEQTVVRRLGRPRRPDEVVRLPWLRAVGAAA